MDFEKLTKKFMKDSLLKKQPFQPVMELSRGEIGTLLFLVFEKDGAFVGEISDRLSLTSGRMATVIKHLERKQYILKKQAKNDRRKMIINVTQKGRDFVEKHGKMVHDRIYNILKFLGEEDAMNYVRINKRLISEFDPNKQYD